MGLAGWHMGAVPAGHPMVRPPEMEPQFLMVSEGGQPSLVQKITWDKVYRKRESPVIPPLFSISLFLTHLDLFNQQKHVHLIKDP